MSEYEKYLDRALAQIVVGKKVSRFKVPKPRIIYEGKTSVLENFDDIVDYLNRDRGHLMKFLLGELGTAGRPDGNRAVFQGKFTEESIGSIIEGYVDEFVICSECNRPDTHLVRSDRILMLKCDACGAHRPVKKRRIRR